MPTVQEPHDENEFANFVITKINKKYIPTTSLLVKNSTFSQ
jgi:hypothetical protein